jgi:hypothetical protein
MQSQNGDRAVPLGAKRRRQDAEIPGAFVHGKLFCIRALFRVTFLPNRVKARRLRRRSFDPIQRGS